jgi:hypothetical protein
MNKEIIFIVENSPDGGLTAKALGESIFTEGDSESDLKRNIRDAVFCHFDTELPSIIRLHYVRDEVIAL